MMEQKWMGFLGLCMRARQLIGGQEKCVEAIRKESVGVVLLDETASPNTQKRVTDACKTHPVPMMMMSDGDIGQAIGKDGCMVVAIPKGNMADKIVSLLSTNNQDMTDLKQSMAK